jgi:hypothetical protein
MINLHPGQSKVFSDLFVDMVCRFQAVCCARGWGKSYELVVAAVTAVFELIELEESVPNKNVAIVAPTYDQVTDIYYPLLMYELNVGAYALKTSREMGRFHFPNNVELRLLSFEAVERMRGKGYYFVGWDEISSCTKGIGAKAAWEGVIQPTIITRWSPERAAKFGAKSPGRAQIITTPKGYNYFYDMFNFEEMDPLWRSYHFDYTQSPFIDAAEIERIKHNIDPIEFATEYLASFEESSARVFYCFDRKVHVRNDLPYFEPPQGDEPGETVHCAIDFNVGIQATSCMAIRGQEVHVLDELKGHPDTESLAIALREIFAGHPIIAYPDPSGKARKTSAPVGVTDFSILESYGIKVMARPKAPPISSSVNAVNGLLMSAAGDVRMYVSVDCQGVIRSFERTVWTDKNPDSATIDKDDGEEHFTDGIRYFSEYKFPIVQVRKRAVRGFNF